MAPSHPTSYLAYVHDDAYMAAYARYQTRYADQIRESDRRLIEIIREHAAGASTPPQRRRLLDIGCSTGNLLRHLKQACPSWELFGTDVAAATIGECRANPSLAGISFAELDVLDLEDRERFDFVVVNAVLCVLDDAQFERALLNIARALTPGGWLVGFDWFHPFAQEITVVERSTLFSDPFTFRFRGYSTVSASLAKAGFRAPDFRPFVLPFDLEQAGDPTDINTYTVKTADGDRLAFRGVLFQPWCHLAVQRSR